MFLQPLMVFPNICQIQRKNSKPKLLIKNGTQCLFMHNVMVSCLTNYESVVGQILSPEDRSKNRD